MGEENKQDVKLPKSRDDRNTSTLIGFDPNHLAGSLYISDRGSASRLYASDIPVSRANQKGNQSRRPVRLDLIR